MEIACVISSLRLGGAERQLVGLADTLVRLGHNPEIITYRGGGFYENAVSDRGLRHKVLDAKGSRSVIKALAGCGHPLMISFLVGTNLKCCMARRLNPSMKLIVSERNCNVGFHLHDLLRFIIYERFADLVLCNNFAQENFIRSHYPRLSDRLATVPNFVDMETFHPSDRPGDGSTSHFVVAARVCRRKNTMGLIRAAGILLREYTADFRIDWYGVQTEDRYVSQCRRAIASEGLQNHFILHEAVSDIAGIYRQADFFCLPSFYEGTSNALAEALASGLPAVCSCVSDNVRYVREGENGFLFDPKDSRGMAGQLYRMATLSPGRRVDFGRRSRCIAEKELAGEAFAEGYKNILAKFAL